MVVVSAISVVTASWSVFKAAARARASSTAGLVHAASASIRIAGARNAGRAVVATKKADVPLAKANKIVARMTEILYFLRKRKGL